MCSFSLHPTLLYKSLAFAIKASNMIEQREDIKKAISDLCSIQRSKDIFIIKTPVTIILFVINPGTKHLCRHLQFCILKP